MAITSNTSITPGAADLPDGYTTPSLPSLNNPEEAEFTTDIAISNADAADPIVGLNNVLSAIQTYFENTYAAATLKLDVTATINANLLVTRIKRVNTASSIFLTGTEVFRCTVKIKYT